MKTKKVLGVLLSVMILSQYLPTVAAENIGNKNEVETEIATGSFTVTRNQMSNEMLEKYEQNLNLTDSNVEMQVGDTKVIYQDENYTLYVELLDCQENNVTRASAEQKKHTYGFTEEDIWGNKETVFEVTITCYWTKDGENSKIDKLHGDYTNYKTSKYELTWTDSTYTETACALYLKWVVYSVDEYNACFSGYLHKLGDYASAPYVELACF